MDGVLRWRREGDWGWRGGAVTANERAVSTRLQLARRRLEWLAVEPSPVDSRGDPSLPVPLRRKLRSPAPPDAIDEAELRLGAALPGDYRRCLLRTDGAMLTSSSAPGESLELFGTGE